MARNKGGPFFALINHHLQAGEFAFSKGDYPNTISHMLSLGALLNVNLPQPPYIDYKTTLVAGGIAYNQQREWILRYRPLISESVRRWMDAHSKGAFGLWKETDDEDESEGDE